ncbi:MAG: hypothetical protein KOO61_04575, partial [Spirochaetales bacterium]|nr:hypothetical protein [Spirochaetales bacterium]
MSSLRAFAARQSRVRTAVLVIFAQLVTFGCTPGVIFYGDQALRAVVPDSEEFARALQRAADDSGHKLALEWDPSTELTAAWLEDRLAQTDAPLVVLSPYFSLFASDLADTHTELNFIGFGGGASGRANLTRVVFDRVPAMRDAGSLVRTWEDAGADRKAAALFLTDSETRRAELDTLADSYRGEGSEGIRVNRFSAPPDRETVRRVIRDLRAEGVNAFLVFIGPSNRSALEVLQSEAVVFATDFASGATSLGDAVLFSVENHMDTGLTAALNATSAGGGGTVTALSVIEIGGAYADPQFGV